MKTRTINIYKFSELSDTAKDRAKSDHFAASGYAWESDYLASLEALAKHFHGKMTNYSIDWFRSSYSSASFSMPEDMSVNEIRVRLHELTGNKDCALTGFCGDEDAIDGFRKAFKAGEHNLEKLMQAAFHTWLHAAQSDCQSQATDEAFGDNCGANDIEFLENGDIA